MTSVPKPLKFMGPHYQTMKEVYEKITDLNVKKVCADIISVLAMTMGEGRENHLAGEIAGEWSETDVSENKEIRDKLILLTKQIVPYNMAHNAEEKTTDLLMEIEL
ncbi:hypothetical protein NQ318_017772 [Aromia moschata]|uniref:RPN1 N-terminal domain-containing protein n=1 Tax=Aromia moschata TaxID=1265417 RepID=A0AAV8XUD0_9CUCU|nr:hypothetical protein NQ318_017772 [Aromia moschata]